MSKIKVITINLQLVRKHEFLLLSSTPSYLTLFLGVFLPVLIIIGATQNFKSCSSLRKLYLAIFESKILSPLKCSHS